MYMQMGGNPGDGATWPAQTGAADAAKALGVKLIEQFSAWQPETMIDQFSEAWPPSRPASSSWAIPGNGAFEDLVKQAVDQGVVVTAGNSPLTELCRSTTARRASAMPASTSTRAASLTAEEDDRVRQAEVRRQGDGVRRCFSQAERGQSDKGLADTLEKAGLKVD